MRPGCVWSARVRCACVDIGSNTTRLLVAELSADGDLREVMVRRAFTRLGSQLLPDGTIPPRAVRHGAHVVAEQVGLARAAGCVPVRVVATAAIRDAANGAEFAAAVQDCCGARVEVLSGEEEARMAFAGAIGSLPTCPDGPVGVVDVGGRSSEIVVGTREGGVTWSASMAIGSGLLADAHLRSDPPHPDELDRVRAHVAGALRDVHAPQAVAAYAAGGSATSLGRLLGGTLDHESLAVGLATLESATCAELAQLLGLHPERVRLLFAAIVLLDGAVTVLGVPLRTCGGGLREGIVLAELARHA
jgi:exopolyphosphatase/guanosine-5'-triphosphate,3'-diphosphate pyrophosphatase